MWPRRSISSFAVIVLAGHAYAQSAEPAPSPPPSPASPQPPPTEPDTICFAGRPFKCASVLLLEVGARGGTKGRAVTSADAGVLIHHGLNAYGGTIGVVGIDSGNAKHDASLWYAARYRRYLGRWGMAGDVSVGYADGPMLEVAIGWSDVVAVTAGLQRYELDDGGHSTIPSVGLRVGSVLIGGLFYVTAIVFSSAR